MPVPLGLESRPAAGLGAVGEALQAPIVGRETIISADASTVAAAAAVDEVCAAAIVYAISEVEGLSAVKVHVFLVDATGGEK